MFIQAYKKWLSLTVYVCVYYVFQGVCHAEKNTEHLSLCYANRSAALFHLGLYTVSIFSLFK